jgi:hypothetical protein
MAGPQREWVERIAAVLCGASTVSELRGASQIVERVRAAGSVFLNIAGRPLVSNPLEKFDSSGNCLGLLTIQHPSLMPDRNAIGTARPGQQSETTQAWASFSYFQDSRSIILSQNVEATEDKITEEDCRLTHWVAYGQLALALSLVHHLRPAYGWVDASGENLPAGHRIAARMLDYIFWANFFGPEYVEMIGEDFLAGAPGFQTTPLDGGGVLFLATQSYLDWWTNEQKSICQYFQQKFPNIKIYRAQSSPDI